MRGHRHSFKFVGRYQRYYTWRCTCGEERLVGCNGFWKGWQANPPWVFNYDNPAQDLSTRTWL